MFESLISNHTFVDGNKRIGHAAIETFLVLKGQMLNADIDGAESLFLNLAAGSVEREQLVAWITSNIVPIAQT